MEPPPTSPIPYKCSILVQRIAWAAIKWIAANFNSSTAVSATGRLFIGAGTGNGTTNTFVTQPAELGFAIGQSFRRRPTETAFYWLLSKDGSSMGLGQ